MNKLPTIKQFKKWSMPAKASVIGLPIAILALLLTFPPLICGPSNKNQLMILNKEDDLANGHDSIQIKLNEINDKLNLPNPDTLKTFPSDLKYFAVDTLYIDNPDAITIDSKEVKFDFKISGIEYKGETFFTTLKADIHDKFFNSYWKNQTIYLEISDNQIAEIDADRFTIFIQIHKIFDKNAIVHLGVKMFSPRMFFRGFVIENNMFRRIVSRNTIIWKNDLVFLGGGMNEKNEDQRIMVLLGNLTSSYKKDVRSLIISIQCFIEGRWIKLDGYCTPNIPDNLKLSTAYDFFSKPTNISSGRFLYGKMFFPIPNKLFHELINHNIVTCRLEIMDTKNEWHLSEFQIQHFQVK